MSEARFRKRPVEVDAICWNGQNLGSVQAFASGALGIGTVEGGALPLWVVKSEAVCNVQQGDWIIREADGSGYYPCAADVFAATYEPADGKPDRAEAAEAAEAKLAAIGTALREHYLAGISCDHARKEDNPVCACSRVFLGWHPSVGEAVEAWIGHVMEVAGGEGEAGNG